MLRNKGRKSRRGMTWIEGVIAIGVFVALGIGLGYALKKPDPHEVSLKRAAALCASSPIDSGSAALDSAVIPRRIHQELGIDFQRVNERRMQWQKRLNGDIQICEMRYAFIGRIGTARDTRYSRWVPTQ